MRLLISGVLLISVFLSINARSEDGYELWLRYAPCKNASQLKEYQRQLTTVFVESGSPTHEIIRAELNRGLTGMLTKQVRAAGTAESASLVVVSAKHPMVQGNQDLVNRLGTLGKEGFLIQTIQNKKARTIIVTANEPAGLMYGTFAFLRMIQQEKSVSSISVSSAPKISHRILNHWDNLDRTVERGYAGFSIWDWHRLPDYIDQRYHDYARANASIGINGTVVTNVNANALILTDHYLEKVQALADVFRPYGIRVYLTARFSAPVESKSLPTADPLDPRVKQWWKDKAEEIYKRIPDFGGFLVKANSEGQPGPQNYNRTHADGANMLAEAVAPFGGIVMWRAFVYDNEVKTDRVKQAYDEFVPLDGKFLPNVIIQAKNGPLDFQPREPFHPLFGAMEKTPLMMEFQLTQEYLGFATHLVYLPTMFKETLDSDTFVKGSGSTVAKTVDGSLFGHSLSAIAGVANIGNDRNWCGHPFAQANWYAYGRLAWDLSLDAREIANEWISQTFSPSPKVVKSLADMMMNSREVTVDYMTPLGLHHIMGWSHHYGPAPWIANKLREDWTSVYYHRADGAGVGFDRTKSGSNALEQYHPEVRKIYQDAQTCPDEYLLWFHHLPWDFKMKSGRTLWDEMCHRYYSGADQVSAMKNTWTSLRGQIDSERHDQVTMLLSIQEKEAAWWRDACVLYFQSFSGKPIPAPLKKPEQTLEYFKSLEFPYAPGIRPHW